MQGHREEDATSSATKSSVREESADAEDLSGIHPEAVDREFDWRGWVLVAAIVVAFFVIPGILVAYPHVGPMFGLGFRTAYLVLPLIPALVLGVIAVWATTRP